MNVRNLTCILFGLFVLCVYSAIAGTATNRANANSQYSQPAFASMSTADAACDLSFGLRVPGHMRYRLRLLSSCTIIMPA